MKWCSKHHHHQFDQQDILKFVDNSHWLNYQNNIYKDNRFSPGKNVNFQKRKNQLRTQSNKRSYSVLKAQHQSIEPNNNESTTNSTSLKGQINQGINCDKLESLFDVTCSIKNSCQLCLTKEENSEYLKLIFEKE